MLQEPDGFLFMSKLYQAIILIVFAQIILNEARYRSAKIRSHEVLSIKSSSESLGRISPAPLSPHNAIRNQVLNSTPARFSSPSG